MALPDKSDVDLLATLAAGDSDALGVLYDRYVDVLFPVAFRIVGERVEAEDVLHDAFVSLCDRAGQYAPVRGSVIAWLVVLVRNLSIDRVRRRQRRGRIVRGELAHEPLEPAPDPEGHRATRAGGAATRARRAAGQPPRLLQATFFEASPTRSSRDASAPAGTIKSRGRALGASARLRARASRLTICSRVCP